MADVRAVLPLDSAAAGAANADLWERYPELQCRSLSMSSSDAAYRSYWIDAYAKAGGQVEHPIAEPPESPVLPCGKLAKPGCGKSQSEYQQQAEAKLSKSPTTALDRNKEITRAYAEMYKSDPSTYKWAGMAAFASCKVGEGMKEAQEAQGGWKAWGASAAGVDAKKLETALVAGNDAVYADIYWQHLAYQGCGIDDIEKAYEEGNITKPVRDAWRKIDAGKRTGNQDLVWEGNGQLLEYEQKTVLQTAVYNTDPALWNIASTGALASWWKKIESPIPGDQTTFQSYAQGASIGTFDKRWEWIQKSMLPKWRSLASDPAKVTKQLEPCTK